MDTQRAKEFESHVIDYFLNNKAISISHYTLLDEQIHKGENRQGIEIKNDQSFEKYGNLYISVKRVYSYQEHTSGLYKNQHWLYVIGIKHSFWIFSTKLLRQYYEQNKPELKRGFTSPKGGTEYGFILNKAQADELCVEKYDNQLKLL